MNPNDMRMMTLNVSGGFAEPDEWVSYERMRQLVDQRLVCGSYGQCFFGGDPSLSVFAGAVTNDGVTKTYGFRGSKDDLFKLYAIMGFDVGRLRNIDE